MLQAVNQPHSQDQLFTGLQYFLILRISEFKSCYGQEFSPLHTVQTAFRVHAASYPMVTGWLFPWG
jgi:hypothetical protein